MFSSVYVEILICLLQVICVVGRFLRGAGSNPNTFKFLSIDRTHNHRLHLTAPILFYYLPRLLISLFFPIRCQLRGVKLRQHATPLKLAKIAQLNPISIFLSIAKYRTNIFD